MKRRDFLKSAAGITAGIPIVRSVHFHEAQDAVLPKRRLGDTDVEVSVLALGGVIGMSLPPADDHDPVAIAERAVELGINYLDTAPGYGRGQSETNFGPVVARHRDKLFLATKVHAPRSYDNAMQSIEKSLARLQTDHVDLLQIHMVLEDEDVSGWDATDGVFTALRKLRDQKVTRFLGVTGHFTTPPMIEAIERYSFDTVLMTLNPTSNRKTWREELLPLAEEKGMGIVAMKVFGGGNGCLVTGNPLREKLAPYHDDTAHQVEASSLVRYVLGLPVSTATMGVASMEELEANIQTAKTAAPMTAAERAEFEKKVA